MPSHIKKRKSNVDLIATRHPTKTYFRDFIDHLSLPRRELLGVPGIMVPQNDCFCEFKI